MCLEDAIKENTAALKALTDLLLGDITQGCLKGLEEAKARLDEPAKEEQLVLDVDYTQLRELVLTLAPIHREEIKSISAKYKLNTIKDMLNNVDDPSQGVKDVELLKSYYKDLLGII